MEGSKIPWEDLIYIFGEIMYGGHIVNDFDRLVANTYLECYLKDELLDEMDMCDLRVLKCRGAFTSLDELVSTSRCRGWSHFGF